MCGTIKRQDEAIGQFSCNSSSLVTSCVWVLTVLIASTIANSCVGQAVIVIIIVVSVKCEQWHKSSAILNLLKVFASKVMRNDWLIKVDSNKTKLIQILNYNNT